MLRDLRGTGQRNVRLYDFRRPDKFSKEQMRTLQLLHDNCARILTTAFSTQFRTVVQAEVAYVQQLTFHEFIQDVADPAIIAVMQPQPLTGSALVVLDPQLAFPMIDRLFGGPGHAGEVDRPLTDIEETVLQRVIVTIFTSLADAWSNLVTLVPALRSMESNPMFAQITAPNEICAVIGFQVSLGAHVGRIQFCIPYLTLEPVISQLSTQQWFAQERQVDEDIKIGSELEHVVVEVWARLGSVTLPLREMLGLKPGDVIPLRRRRGDPIELFVEDQPKFLVNPGRRGERLAVQVEGAYDPNEGSDDKWTTRHGSF